MAMLAMAAAETGGGDDGNVSRTEAKSILSRLARGSDPNVRIKALESLNKIESQEQEQRAAKDAELRDPEEIFREMEAISPEAAAFIRQGVEWKGLSANERGLLEARRWIAENPDAARRFLAEALRTNATANAN